MRRGRVFERHGLLKSDWMPLQHGLTFWLLVLFVISSSVLNRRPLAQLDQSQMTRGADVLLPHTLLDFLLTMNTMNLKMIERKLGSRYFLFKATLSAGSD